VWRWVQPRIGRLTRVCSYDRAGIGQSAPVPPGQHRTPQTQVHELHQLLRSAQIPPPYILVGHSWGGFLARLFAHDYPHDTVGVVLVDATTFAYLTPAVLRHLPRKRTKEGIYLHAALAESAAITSLGHLPLVVLGHGHPALDQHLLKAQDAEARLSNNSINAIALTSSHYIQKPPPIGQPEVVITAVRAVISATRQRRHLPSCKTLFTRAAVECRP
jgi:pimeloyl-ACP methyl ester carboxylesterase